VGFTFNYKYFKFVAAVTGFYLGGILGGISAFLLVREIIDNADYGVDILELSLLRLSSLMIKADGRIDEEEIKVVRAFFYKSFGNEKANKLFKELKKSPPIPSNIDEILDVIKARLEPTKLYSIIQFLYTISIADGHLAFSEDEFIFNVGKKLGFTIKRLNEIRNQFVEPEKTNNHNSSEKSVYLNKLGLSGNPSQDEIKNAFRRLAKEYHPDKLAGVNETIKKIAEEKFREIREAYDYLTAA
jgi:DnaJ like chaperone protein